MYSQTFQNDTVGQGFLELVSPYHIHGNHIPFVPEILLVFCGILALF